MNQRRNLIIFCALITIGLLWFSSHFLKETPSKNIILISIDTLRPDHMGIYGYNRNTTPNIDTFAKKATVYTNMRTVIPMTYPSFAAFMTSRDPLKSRLTANGTGLMSDTTITLPKILKENGYTTAAYTTGALSYLFNGFEESDFLTYKYFYYGANRNELYGQTSRSDYEKFLTNSKEWLIKNKDKRFFFWVHLMDPHAPYWPPDNMKCEFLSKEACEYVKATSNRSLDDERAAYQFCQAKSPPENVTAVQKGLYDVGIKYSDNLVGKILDEIKKQGLDKNSIIILYSDHGEGFDHNYYFNHRDVVFESAIRIPFIMYDPDKSAGQNNTFMSNLDIMPTILDRLHISYEKLPIDGKSIEKNMFQSIFDNFFQKKYIYGMNSKLTKFYIADERYKYIYSLSNSCLLDGKMEELYDIKKDPDEKNNLIKENEEVKNILKEKLLYYLSSYNLPAKKTTNSSPADAWPDDEKLGTESADVNNGRKLDQLKSLQY